MRRLQGAGAERHRVRFQIEDFAPALRPHPNHFGAIEQDPANEYAASKREINAVADRVQWVMAVLILTPSRLFMGMASIPEGSGPFMSGLCR